MILRWEVYPDLCHGYNVITKNSISGTQEESELEEKVLWFVITEAETGVMCFEDRGKGHSQGVQATVRRLKKARKQIFSWKPPEKNSPADACL